METVVIALGGNSILKKREKIDYKNQYKNARNALSHLVSIFRKYNVVLTHGSGPQVGSLLLQSETSKRKVPQMPLDVLDAEIQGQLGYIIEQSLINLVNKYRIKKLPISVLTQVLVDKNDLSFKNPTKFVGPFYSSSQAKRLRNKFVIRKDSDRGYRRVVPSPEPLKIIEYKVIKELVKDHIVIAAGGGGIPVYKKNNILHGVEAVVDKDLASYVLARDIKANYLFILTGVDKVYLNYGKKNQKDLGKIKVKALKKYYKEGHFLAGSMGPKVEAAIKFLEHNGKEVIITKPELLEKAIKGKAGTIITK